MGCQSFVVIGNNLTFSITTHDPDTGELTDADAAPAYRVYEDETGTAILTGNMAILDDANTTGFYSEQIACTTANGFEAGKSYNVYITATVDGDTGGISYGFTALAAAPSTTSAIADAVWDELSTGHTTAGKAGQQLWTDIDAIKAKTDLISQNRLTVQSAVRGSTISVYNYTTWSVYYANSAIDVSGQGTAFVSVKRNLSDSDDDAILRVQEGAGLLRFNGTAAAAGSASLTISNGSAFTLTVSEAITGIDPNDSLVWDWKQVQAGDTDEIVQGKWRILGAVTRQVTT